MTSWSSLSAAKAAAGGLAAGFQTGLFDCLGGIRRSAREKHCGYQQKTAHLATPICCHYLRPGRLLRALELPVVVDPSRQFLSFQFNPQAFRRYPLRNIAQQIASTSAVQARQTGSPIHGELSETPIIPNLATSIR